MKRSVRGTMAGLTRRLLAAVAAGAVAVVVTMSTDRIAAAQDEARLEYPREDIAETGCRGPEDCPYGAIAELLETALTTDSTVHPDGTVTLHATLIRTTFDYEYPLQDRRIRFIAAENPLREAVTDTDGRASCTAPKPVNELPGTFRAYFDEVANLAESTDGGIIRQP